MTEIPDPFEFTGATSGPRTKCRHLIYDIFNRSRLLVDDPEEMMIDGRFVSVEADGIEDIEGRCKSLRILEARYANQLPAVEYMLHGQTKIQYEPATEVDSHVVHAYLVETAKKKTEEDMTYVVEGEWTAFALVVAAYSEDGTLVTEIVHPDTGKDFEEIEQYTLLDILRAMDDSVREEQIYQKVITQPFQEPDKTEDVDYGAPFKPDRYIFHHTCENCELSGVFCNHTGNLN